MINMNDDTAIKIKRIILGVIIFSILLLVGGIAFNQFLIGKIMTLFGVVLFPVSMSIYALRKGTTEERERWAKERGKRKENEEQRKEKEKYLKQIEEEEEAKERGRIRAREED